MHSMDIHELFSLYLEHPTDGVDIDRTILIHILRTMDLATHRRLALRADCRDRYILGVLLRQCGTTELVSAIVQCTFVRLRWRLLSVSVENWSY